MRGTYGIDIPHHRHDQFAGIGFINEPQDGIDFVVGDLHPWILRIGFRTSDHGFDAHFPDIIKEGVKLIVFLDREGIIFMIVAMGAFQGHAQQSLPEEVSPVGDIAAPVFLGDDAAFLRDLVIAVEGRREDLFAGGIGQQVAGQLPGDKLVVRQVPVEGIDDPVAPGPLGAVAIVLITVRIGVAGEVQPMNGHLLPISRLFQEFFDDLFVGCWSVVGQKTVHHLDGWRQAGEVETDPAEESFFVGRIIGFQTLLFLLRQDEMIDLIAGPVGAIDLRERPLLGWHESPVLFVACPLLDPAFD